MASSKSHTSSSDSTPASSTFYIGPQKTSWNPKNKMTSMAKNFFFNKVLPTANSVVAPQLEGFTKAHAATDLFPKTDPKVDGDDCIQDCESCTVKYPRTFKIDEEDQLYGFVKGWSRHILCATGKTDWVRDVSDEKGSIMEAVGKHSGLHKGKLMLSASNIPVPENPEVEDSTSVLLLPAFTIVDNVTPATVPDLIKHVINEAPTNTDPLDGKSKLPQTNSVEANGVETNGVETNGAETNGVSSIPSELKLKIRPCPHNYLILLCSQKTRDARCGQSAPLLRKELERHLRPLGLYRDLHDERPGGVGIYFISHVGGHKYSANVMVYRRASAPHLDGPACETEKEEHKVEEVVAHPGSEDAKEVNLGAAQCIWLARIRPEDCENLIKYTVLQGKVLKPEYQLRGGFDRQKQLTSW